MSSWIEISVHLNVSLNYISCLRCLSRSLSYPFAGCFQSYMNIACCTQKCPRVSCGAKDYGVLEVKCKREWFQNLFLLGEISTSFILKHNSITAYCSFKHLTARIASLALGKIQKWLSGRVILEIGENKIFRKFLLSFYNLLCKGSAGLDRPEYWISVICLVRLFCEKLQNYK